MAYKDSLFRSLFGNKKAALELYNETAPFPDRETLRMSDAYERVEGFDKIDLQLEVQVYNINEGRNAEVVSRCEELKGYAYFVYRARYHEAEERKKGALPEKDITRTAVKKAIQALDIFITGT